MRFMMLLKGDAITEAGVMPDQEILLKMNAYNEELAKAGVMLGGNGLHPTSRGAKLRLEAGKRSVIDGPFTESKEILAGYWVIKTGSKEEAVEWAKRIPLGDDEAYARDGRTAHVEVRQVFEAEEEEEALRASVPGEPGQASEGAPTKQFMCMVKADKCSEMGQAPKEEVLAAMGELMSEMAQKGVLVDADGLYPTSHGARIEYAGSKRTVTDGPFAETKELLGGFSILRANSLAEAVELSWRCLEICGDGEIEVRQIFQAEDFGGAYTPEVRAAEARVREQIASQ